MSAVAPMETRAQDISADAVGSDERAQDDDIVVTGTLIRGIAPAGSSVIAVARQQIEDSGATSVNQLLAHVPQVTNFFNALPAVGANAGGANVGFPINRPNLRNLPASASGSQTLILIDGHRIVNAGITQFAIDPDVVPTAMIERVDAITDGGSAVYGSDAIGGVLNFITRRRFNGLEATGHFGFAADYRTFDASVTAGRDWGSGSLFASYSYAHHNALFGYDRDFLKTIDWNTGRGAFLTCTPGNVSVSTRTYALPGLVLGAGNTCDSNLLTTFYPEETRHSVYAGLSQDLSDRLKVDIRVLYMHRANLGSGGALAGYGVATVGPTNPYYRNLPGIDANASQTVRFDYSTVFGNDAAKQRNILETWQVTPSFVYDLGGAWAARALFAYGKSTAIYDNIEINATTQAALARGTTFANAINPYDLAATQNRALLDQLIGRNIGRGENEMFNARLVFDGPLVTLPGGDIQVAVGAEYLKNAFVSQLTSQTTYQPQPVSRYNQAVKSLMAEVQVPLFGADNAVGGIDTLSLSASARYDSYNDFGDTFNPKIGVTYKPVDWFTLRGYWGKSFNAPNPAEQLRTFANAILALPGGIVPAGTTPPPGAFSLLLRAGAAQGLQPQTSTNWSLGGEIRPPVVPGLELSASYYRINYDNMLGTPDISNNFASFFAIYPGLYTLNPTADQIRAAAAQTSAGEATVSQFLQPGGPRVVSILDVRTRNLGSARLAGLDFAARYAHETGFGSIDASFAGNYQLTLDVQGAPASPFVDTLAVGISRLKFAASLGATVGGFRASATLNHNAGYAVTRSAILPQDHVDAFNVVNLAFRHRFASGPIGKDLTLTLNIDNLFDTDPPVYKLSDGLNRGYANGLTLGRLVQLGITTKF